jgi:hypothetical protein
VVAGRVATLVSRCEEDEAEFAASHGAALAAADALAAGAGTTSPVSIEDAIGRHAAAVAAARPLPESDKLVEAEADGTGAGAGAGGAHGNDDDNNEDADGNSDGTGSRDSPSSDDDSDSDGKPAGARSSSSAAQPSSSSSAFPRLGANLEPLPGMSKAAQAARKAVMPKRPRPPVFQGLFTATAEGEEPAESTFLSWMPSEPVPQYDADPTSAFFGLHVAQAELDAAEQDAHAPLTLPAEYDPDNYTAERELVRSTTPPESEQDTDSPATASAAQRLAGSKRPRDSDASESEAANNTSAAPSRAGQPAATEAAAAAAAAGSSDTSELAAPSDGNNAAKQAELPRLTGLERHSAVDGTVGGQLPVSSPIAVKATPRASVATEAGSSSTMGDEFGNAITAAADGSRVPVTAALGSGTGGASAFNAAASPRTGPSRMSAPAAELGAMKDDPSLPSGTAASNAPTPMDGAAAVASGSPAVAATSEKKKYAKKPRSGKEVCLSKISDVHWSFPMVMQVRELLETAGQINTGIQPHTSFAFNTCISLVNCVCS